MLQNGMGWDSIFLDYMRGVSKKKRKKKLLGKFIPRACLEKYLI